MKTINIFGLVVLGALAGVGVGAISREVFGVEICQPCYDLGKKHGQIVRAWLDQEKQP